MVSRLTLVSTTEASHLRVGFVSHPLSSSLQGDNKWLEQLSRGSFGINLSAAAYAELQLISLNKATVIFQWVLCFRKLRKWTKRQKNNEHFSGVVSTARPKTRCQSNSHAAGSLAITQNMTFYLFKTCAKVAHYKQVSAPLTRRLHVAPRLKVGTVDCDKFVSQNYVDRYFDFGLGQLLLVDVEPQIANVFMQSKILNWRILQTLQLHADQEVRCHCAQDSATKKKIGKFFLLEGTWEKKTFWFLQKHLLTSRGSETQTFAKYWNNNKKMTRNWVVLLVAIILKWQENKSEIAQSTLKIVTLLVCNFRAKTSWKQINTYLFSSYWKSPSNFNNKIRELDAWLLFVNNWETCHIVRCTPLTSFVIVWW